jgi:type IV secretion system protein VirD4
MDMLLGMLQDPKFIFLIGIFLFLAIANSGQTKKGQLTKAVLANNRIKYNLAKTAVKQLKKRQIKNVCLYSGSFKDWQTNWLTLTLKILFTSYPPSLFVPSANQSIEVIGAPGSGKTFGIIDRLLVSAIEQRFPVLLYDYKGGPGGEGGQIPYIGAYAARHRYKIRIFAPGRDYSCTINPLDFIRDEKDMTMAETIAKNFHDNLRADSGKTDGFFGPAGQRVLFASFLLAKNTKYPDLAMSFALLQLSDFPERLKYAATQNSRHFSQWIQIGFKQIISVANAPETSSGILAGAQDLVTTFIQHDLLRCFIGPSNTSLDLGEKEILIFQSDLARQQVVNPLIAAVVETLINQNFSYQRKIPLVCSFDECRTLKIKNLPNWANEHRSKGFCGIYGYQSIEQLEDAYGKNGASIFRSALGNRFWFNPGNLGTAKNFSETIGQKEVIVKNKSYSRNLGGSGGQRSISEQLQLVPIFRPDDFMSFPQGTCVFINSLLKKGDRGYIPWYLPKVYVSKKDRKIEDECKAIWSKEIVPKLTKKEENTRLVLDLEEELRKRTELAEILFPLPPKESETVKKTPVSSFNTLTAIE